MASRSIHVPALARVEGEGALFISLRGGRVADVQLRIYEPPRFFEAFLRGRGFGEAPDITARICGICPVAYQMSAVHAMEDALGIAVTAPVRALRRLLYCGEWIESHVLHVFLLHAPDFLGYEDALRLARDHPEPVQRALRLKKIGNALVAAVAGRAIHPINVRVGGFYSAPAPRDLLALRPELERGRDEALEALRWAARLPVPEFERDYRFVALRHDTEYPMNEGRVVSSDGLDIDVHEYEEHFEEQQVPHATALHSVLKGHGAYMVGPLARLVLNFDRLSPGVQRAAREAGVGPGCRNPFRSLLVRLVETLHAFDEALRLIAAYEPPEPPAVSVTGHAGTGCAATEAPRGILYHRYRLADDGSIAAAKIVPPTSQNQRTIENDLRALVEDNLSLARDQLTWRCEQAIRNYDPCISCATHFVRLEIEER